MSFEQKYHYRNFNILNFPPFSGCMMEVSGLGEKAMTEPKKVPYRATYYNITPSILTWTMIRVLKYRVEKIGVWKVSCSRVAPSSRYRADGATRKKIAIILNPILFLNLQL